MTIVEEVSTEIRVDCASEDEADSLPSLRGLGGNGYGGIGLCPSCSV